MEFEYEPENAVYFQHQQFDYPNSYGMCRIRLLPLEFTCTTNISAEFKNAPKNYFCYCDHNLATPRHWHTYLPVSYFFRMFFFLFSCFFACFLCLSFSAAFERIHIIRLSFFYVKHLCLSLFVYLSQFVFHFDVNVFFFASFSLFSTCCHTLTGFLVFATVWDLDRHQTTSKCIYVFGKFAFHQCSSLSLLRLKELQKFPSFVYFLHLYTFLYSHLMECNMCLSCNNRQNKWKIDLKKRDRPNQRAHVQRTATNIIHWQFVLSNKQIRTHTQP